MRYAAAVRRRRRRAAQRAQRFKVARLKVQGILADLDSLKSTTPDRWGRAWCVVIGCPYHLIVPGSVQVDRATAAVKVRMRPRPIVHVVTGGIARALVIEAEGPPP